MAYTAISLKGDKDYARLLTVIAAKRGVKVGQLVRDAIDAHLHDELTLLEGFFAHSDSQNNHSDSTKKESA